jgi:SAM-dependent methyltransferase
VQSAKLRMDDLGAIAPGLNCDADGIWRARSAAAIDYPDEANAFCFAIEERSFWFAHRNAIIVEAVRRFPPAGPIADIGAGNGFVSMGLGAAGFSTVVIEPGPAGARNAHARGLAPVVCATLGDARFADSTLAAAGLFDVLEHIADDLGFLAELHRVLEPDARVYITVPAFGWLWSSEDELVGHHRRYSIASLTRALVRSGFRVDYATYFFAPLPLPLWLLRTVPSRLGARTTLDPRQTAAELQPSAVVANLVARALSPERRFVRRGWRIPLGTSCLAVAAAV